MPNPTLRLSQHQPSEYKESDFHRYLSGGDDNGRTLLPEATDKIVDTTQDVEFDHPHYGRVRATYLCYSYKHKRNRFISWVMQSAVQLDPDAPRPRPYAGDHQALGIGGSQHQE